jgi:hypothetical protein
MSRNGKKDNGAQNYRYRQYGRRCVGGLSIDLSGMLSWVVAMVKSCWYGEYDRNKSAMTALK